MSVVHFGRKSFCVMHPLLLPARNATPARSTTRSVAGGIALQAGVEALWCTESSKPISVMHLDGIFFVIYPN
jgi:hypothetical protein